MEDLSVSWSFKKMPWFIRNAHWKKLGKTGLKNGHWNFWKKHFRRNYYILNNGNGYSYRKLFQRFFKPYLIIKKLVLSLARLALKFLTELGIINRMIQITIQKELLKYQKVKFVKVWVMRKTIIFVKSIANIPVLSSKNLKRKNVIRLNLCWKTQSKAFKKIPVYK